MHTTSAVRSIDIVAIAHAAPAGHHEAAVATHAAPGFQEQPEGTGDGGSHGRRVGRAPERSLAKDGGREGADATHGGANQHTADTPSHEWYRHLGESHRKRDQALRDDAAALIDRNHARMLACHHRWPMIIAAMRGQIRSYNDGFGRDAIVLVDTHSSGDELTATVSAGDGQRFVLAVDDGDLWVRASETGRSQREQRIGIDRSDEATAAYILQDWLARL